MSKYVTQGVPDFTGMSAAEILATVERMRVESEQASKQTASKGMSQAAQPTPSYSEPPRHGAPVKRQKSVRARQPKDGAKTPDERQGRPEERPGRPEERPERAPARPKQDKPEREPKQEKPERGPKRDKPEREPKQEKPERGPKRDKPEREPKQEKPERGPKQEKPEPKVEAEPEVEPAVEPVVEPEVEPVVEPVVERVGAGELEVEEHNDGGSHAEHGHPKKKRCRGDDCEEDCHECHECHECPECPDCGDCGECEYEGDDVQCCEIGPVDAAICQAATVSGSVGDLCAYLIGGSATQENWIIKKWLKMAADAAQYLGGLLQYTTIASVRYDIPRDGSRTIYVKVGITPMGKTFLVLSGVGGGNWVGPTDLCGLSEYVSSMNYKYITIGGSRIANDGTISTECVMKALVARAEQAIDGLLNPNVVPPRS